MLLSLESTPTHQTLSRHSHCISYCSCSHQLPPRLLQFFSLWRTSTCHTKLQRVQNSLARIVRQSDSLAHSKPLLWQLHWLLVHSRIRFKLATITYKALCTNSPQYLASHIRYHQPVRSLRSSDQQFFVPTPSSTNFGSRSFRSATPVIWNSLPLAIRTSATIDTFKRCLKTHYFCFPPVQVIFSPCIRFIHDVLIFNIYLHYIYIYIIGLSSTNKLGSDELNERHVYCSNR